MVFFTVNSNYQLFFLLYSNMVIIREVQIMEQKRQKLH